VIAIHHVDMWATKAKEGQPSRNSNLLTAIADLQLELEALKSHQHVGQVPSS
jgi:hypothetical protein